jgi:hypothetical protein
MQIPIIVGIYANSSPEWRTAYPVNMIPVPKSNGISEGFLRPAYGLELFAEGPGADRGGIVWDGLMYRVMGTKLISVDSAGLVTIIGDVGVGSQCSFDFSFTQLAVTSGGRLYLWDKTTFQQVTDPDLGVALTVLWVDGYFMTTDGQFLVVTDLNDPTSVDPLKYGSSEVDPDPIVALLKVRDEVVAVNANTIEYFDNIGGQGFPFQRVAGAQIQKGCVGTHACCNFLQQFAFVGGARNEATGVFVGANAQANKISTQEVDQVLAELSPAQQAGIFLEALNMEGHYFLYMHLPDRVMVYDAAASEQTQTPVWFQLTSAVEGFGPYLARAFLYCYGAWYCGDPVNARIGRQSKEIMTHYGSPVRWEFSTAILYNQSNGVSFNDLELVSLTGTADVGTNPLITTSYSLDGQSWSQPMTCAVGMNGNRLKRIVWWTLGIMKNWRIQRFQGYSNARISVARLEATLEPLAW